MGNIARPMTTEEQVPLFDAIQAWATGNISQRMDAVVEILGAVRRYGTAIQREAREEHRR